ncbi:MAG: hypothetical protein Q9201_002484 [Fulgogasparrea decipioides]
MRCIRDEARVKCNRCFDAKADCVFSIARKAGRPPTNSKRALSTSGGHTEDENSSTKSAPSLQSPNGRRHWEQERRAPSLNDIPTAHIARQLDMDFSSDFFETSGSVVSLDNVSSPTVSFGMDVPHTSTSAAPGTITEKSLPWSESHNQPLYQESTRDCLNEVARSNEGAILDMFADLPPSPPFVYTSQEEKDTHSGPMPSVGSGRAKHNPKPRPGELVRAPDFETFGVRSGDGLISHATDPGGDLQAATMQQLSELGRKLFAQTATTPGEEGSSHRDVPYTPGDGSLVDFNSNASPNAENASMNRLEQLTAHVIESSSVFCSILRHISPHASFDMAATMLMLTTYVRLAQLHHTLYAHIQSLLTSSDTQTPLVTPNSFAHATPPPSEQSFSLNVASTRTATNWTTPSSRSPTPVVFPHLQIGGVSLAVYPRFQLKFILQICVHHLGDVEILLGLPAECCVSGLKGSQRHGRPDSEDGGILHRNTGGKTLLVQTVMMEAKGTIKGIRRILADLTEELRSSIQV